MENIAYIGLQKETLAYLQTQGNGQVFALQEVQEADLASALAHAGTYSAFLLGEETENPIKATQEIYRRDRHLSILVLTDKARLPQLKQALQFSPFIGTTVRAASNETGERLLSILQDLRQRTQQRRSYAQVKSVSTPVTDFSGNLYQQIKAEYMGRVLEEAPIGAILLHSNGTVLTANPFSLHLFQKVEHEVINKPFAQLFPAPLQEQAERFLRQEYHVQPKQEFSLLGESEERHLEISLASITKGGAHSHLICIINDITQMVQAKKLMEAHLLEVEAINTDLKHTNHELDTFVYAASHDLKSPIVNIEGLVNMLDEELVEATPDVQMALKLIRGAVGKFKQTLADMSEVIKSQKAMASKAVSLSVAEVVEEIKCSIESEIKMSKAVIEVDASQVPYILFSKSNFKSILYNLISNAIKYRSPGHPPRIFIKTAKKQDGVISLSVTDNGLGIPDKKQAQVFTMFKRLHSHVEGTGLGLHIVKRIVDKVGGTITIYSKEGEGTTFEILLKQ